MRLRSGLFVLASQILPHQSWQTISVWTLFCARGHCHAETRKGLAQSRNTESSRMSLYAVALRLVRGQARTMKNSPRPLFLLHQTLQLALCIRAGSFLTPLQTKLSIAHGDLRLVCVCLAMETHFMKLPTNRSCANVASRGNLELGSECCNRRQAIFTCYMLFSTLQSRSVSLCGLPLRSWAVVDPRNFHFTITALAVDRGSSIRANILWRWHPMTVIGCHVGSHRAIQ